MAKELDVIQRQISLNPQPLPAFTAGEALLQELKRFSQIPMTMATNLAIEQASIEGVKQRAAGVEYNLAPSITGPTEAFNRAYRDTDARIVARAGIDQIAEILVHESDPRNLHPGSVASFDAKTRGVIEGVSKAALPENQFAVQDQLANVASSGRNRLMSKVIDMEHKQGVRVFKEEFDQLKTDRLAAILAKDADALAGVDAQISKVLGDHSALSQEIARNVPFLIKELQQDEAKAAVLADFIEAQSEGRGDEYLANFAQENKSGLNTQDYLEVMGRMLKINRTTDIALDKQRNLNRQILSNDIKNPEAENHPQTLEELQQHPLFETLSPIQQQQTISEFVSSMRSTFAKNAKLAEAFKEIGLGRAGALDKGMVDDIFTGLRSEAEAQNNAPLTLAQQFQIVNQLQTNAPQFDKLLNAKFTSFDVTQTLEAGQLYATARLANKDQLIHLSGDAAIMAEKMATLLNGTAMPPDEAVKSVINQVLKKDDPVIAQRNQAAAALWNKKGPEMFKTVFGSAPDPFANQGAFKIFEEAFFSAYANGANEDEAARIARNAMRSWSKSQWYINEGVGEHAPENELPLANGTQAVKNQILMATKSIMDRYNAKLQSGQLPMSFTGVVDFDALKTQEDLAFKTISLPGQILVNVDGVESELKLLPSAQTKASPQEGLVYGLAAKDAFGNYQQLKDPDSPDGLAYVVLKDLNQITPSVFDEKNDEALKERFQATLNKQLEAALKEEVDNTTFGKALNKIPLGKVAKDLVVKGVVTFTSKPELDANKIKEQLKQVTPAPEPVAQQSSVSQIAQPKAAKAESSMNYAKEVATNLRLKPAKHAVVATVIDAAKKVGVDPREAVAIVSVESNFNPTARATTSSATGLYQFTRATWAEMVKRHGAKYNISMQDITDPRANAIMGALLTKENGQSLTRALGHDPDSGELYLAHFAGVRKAIRIITALKETPNASVTAFFTPAEIAANRNIVRGTIKETYDRLTAKVRRVHDMTDGILGND